MVERIELIERHIKIFSVHKIRCIFGDREFISGLWSAFLSDKGIHFVMRIKVNFQITDAGGISVSAKTLFIENDLPIGSGEVESAHRYVIQDRLKIAGAWWKENNAGYMSALKTLRADDNWEDCWDSEFLKAA
ncbi:hypothetical protein QUF90_01240 [Desulfococcaceae bacterium HSG9]|nr:hypothetical protein [Desulfococcaceae bacterium HSG9]